MNRIGEARNSPEPDSHASKVRITRSVAGLLAFSWLALSGCAGAPVTRGIPDSLSPRGPAAENIASLWWLMFGLGTAVFIAVTVLLLYAVRKRRRYDLYAEVDMDPPDGRSWIWWGGIILPAVILAITFAATMVSLSAIARPQSAPALEIEVTGRQWWWEVRYPGLDFTTANELHLPVGEPALIHLTSGDVIHSFWVPQVHGKLDLNPGEINSFIFESDQTGIYRGLCAEFCGLQHANMQFMVVVESGEDFDLWVARQQQPAPIPLDEPTRRGQQVFLGSACVYCHTVRGTNATGDLGPDLTHFASRMTIGAGILENNRGNLAGWIVDPQHTKPGNLMPPSNLNSQDLQSILDYLATLH
jgi:cytochrome c oxidase subunit II